MFTPHFSVIQSLLGVQDGDSWMYGIILLLKPTYNHINTSPVFPFPFGVLDAGTSIIIISSSSAPVLPFVVFFAFVSNSTGGCKCKVEKSVTAISNHQIALTSIRATEDTCPKWCCVSLVLKLLVHTTNYIHQDQYITHPEDNLSRETVVCCLLWLLSGKKNNPWWCHQGLIHYILFVDYTCIY